MGQGQVSGGVSVLCWLAAPVAMFYGNLQNSVITSKSVLKSSSVISLQIIQMYYIYIIFLDVKGANIIHNLSNTLMVTYIY